VPGAVTPRSGWAATAVSAAVLLAGCASDAGPADRTAATAAPPGQPPAVRAESPVTLAPQSSPSLPPDPRWRFFTSDRTRYASAWFPGRHRLMIGYGCSEAPYYRPDPRCPSGQGFHHGVDVALPCGTPILAGLAGRVVEPAAGTVGPAYGEQPVVLRVGLGGRPAAADVLVAHAARVLVGPGDQVRPGQQIAVAGASGAPDGCHLHLEVRAPGGGVTTARDPGPVLRLR
jgi:murein DD-endopeptidase MepM/ murein hydrolase activator NlpD